jgi:predicted nuclease of predicted toxin-antitoxin system
MRILFDENTPFSLARDLIGHESSHVIRLGWRGTKNGALLTRAEQVGFDVLITLDDDMKPEQNMSGRKIAVLVVKPAEQGKQAMKAMARHVLLALTTIEAGEIRVVEPSDD